MSTLVCGRCGNRTAPNSTYCAHDRWTLWVDTMTGQPRFAESINRVEVPRGVGGLLERRRLEKQRSQLEHQLEDLIDKRIEKLEKRLEESSADAETHRTLGVLTLLQRHYERAHAHLKRAHELNPHDFETHINYAIVLTQRGNLQAALELLQAAHKQWPNTPLVLFNLALVGLQARRANLVLQAVAALEALWKDNKAIAADYFQDAMTARGLALLLLHRNEEAQRSLQIAASGSDAPLFSTPAGGDGTSVSSSGTDNVDDYASAERESLIHAVENYGRDELADSGASATQLTVAPNGQESSEQGHMDRRVAPPNVPWPHHERRTDRGSARNRSTESNVTNVATPPSTTQQPEIVLSNADVSADLLNNLAIAEAANGQTERAIARLTAAMRMEPGNARVHNNLGVLAYEHGNLEAAYRHFDFARQIEEYAKEPEAETHNHLGVVLAAMGKLEESWEEFQRAGSHERAEFEVFYNMGRAYIEIGKADRGVAYLKRAFQANPQHPDVHVVLGAAYLLRGNEAMLAEALKSLKRALQLQPRHLIAFCNLALTLCEMGNQDGARMVINQALKAFPRSPELVFLRAVITLDDEEENAVARAGALFSAALNMRPDMIVSSYDMALCQFVLGMRDAAAQQLEGVTKRDVAFAPAYYMMGVGHALANRHNEALAAWQKASEYEPGNPDLQANMGYLYYQRKDWQNAIACYMRAHRAAPTDADILACLGLSFGRAAAVLRDTWEAIALKKSTTPKPGNAQEERTYNDLINKAITVFEQSLQIKPHTPITHSNLGLVYYFQKQVEKAVDQWRIVSQLDARYASSREEDQYRNFDESQISMRPLNWRTRVVSVAPLLPQPHTRLLPGHNARDFRPAISDPKLEDVRRLRHELEQTVRLLGWGHVHK